MKAKMQLLMVIGILFSCYNDEGDKSKFIDMRINDFQNTGIAVGSDLTLLVQKGNNIGTDSWTKLYSNIEGLDYEPGKIYNISVSAEPIDNPPADGSFINSKS